MGWIELQMINYIQFKLIGLIMSLSQIIGELLYRTYHSQIILKELI